MSFYGILVLLHVIGAVCGIGAQFAQPFLFNRVKTAKQAEFAHHVNHGIDKLTMGAMNTYLFTQGWYLISLILFVTILPVAGGIVPKKAAKQIEILNNHKGDDLPESYLSLKKQVVPFNRYTYIASVIIVILMVTKPFN